MAALMFTQIIAPVCATPQDDKASAESEINSANAELNDVIVRYDKANSELNQTEQAIADKTAELAKTEENLGKARASFDERARGLYKYGDVNILEVIFGSKTMTDFTERFDLMNRVGTADAVLVKQISGSAKNLEQTKSDLEAAKTKQTQLVDQVSADRAAIEGQVATKLSRLNEIENQIAAEAVASRAADDNSNDTPSVWGGTLPPASAGVVAIARALIGIPYVYGSHDPSVGFDCSGLVEYCYRQIGVELNWTVDYTPNLTWDQLEPGDIVISHGGGHVGIYTGGGMQIHAPYPGSYVQESPVYSFYGGYRP